METTRTTFAKFNQQLQILFFAMLVGLIGISGILYFFVQPIPFTGDPMFFYIGGAVLVATTAVSLVLGKKFMADAREKTSVEEKLLHFRQGQIVRMALRDGAVLINLMLYFFVSGHPDLLYFAGIGFVLFALLMPSRERIIRELDLGSDDVARLDSEEILINMPSARR